MTSVNSQLGKRVYNFGRMNFGISLHLEVTLAVVTVPGKAS